MTGLAGIRRGLGVIFVLAGLLHGAVMTLATLYSLGRLRVVIGPGLWSELYYSHFLFLVLASLGYLTLSYKRSAVFYWETLLDFLVGMLVFIVLLGLVGIVLVRGLANPWLSLLPGTFLAAFGLGLFLGRPMGFGREN